MRGLKEIEHLLDQSLAEYIEVNHVPGFAIGIVLEGKLAYSKGFGVKTANQPAAVDEQVMFHSASISKTFVATALMQLWEKGLLDIDSPVVHYLPYFKLKDQRYAKITVKQMMSHISGMPDVHDYEWDKPRYDEGALEEYVRSICDSELLWEPGSAFAYSNLAYEILGDVIAKVSGMSFESYVKQNILVPLGMKNSSFLIGEVSKDLMTSPHVLDVSHYIPRVNEFYPYNRIHGPSSTLWSNIVELSRYACANLNKGILEGVRILKESTYDMLWHPYAEIGNTADKVGLSWFLWEYKGEQLVSHAGGDTGYLSNLVLIPQKKAALVFYCNCDYINLNGITKHILDIILNTEIEPLKVSAAVAVAKAIAQKGIAEGEAVFEDIRLNQTEGYVIIENDFNSLAYRYLGIHMLKEAIAVLNMAIKVMPDAANLYDSLGEMYLENNEREKAIDSYKQSLKLNPQKASSIEALRKIGILI